MVKKFSKEQIFGYPAWAHSVVGDLDLKVDETTSGELHVTLWDSKRRQDWQGRIFPVVDITLTKEKSSRTVRFGLFGLGGRVDFRFDPKSHSLSLRTK